MATNAVQRAIAAKKNIMEPQDTFTQRAQTINEPYEQIQQENLSERYGRLESGLRQSEQGIATREKDILARRFAALQLQGGEDMQQRAMKSAERASQRRLTSSLSDLEQQRLAAEGELEDIFAGRRYETEQRLRGEDYQTGEREKAQQFTTGEREKAQQFATAEREKGQQFTTAERAASEKFATSQRQEAEAAAALESEKDRALNEKIYNLNRALTQQQINLQRDELELNAQISIENARQLGSELSNEMIQRLEAIGIDTSFLRGGYYKPNVIVSGNTKISEGGGTYERPKTGDPRLLWYGKEGLIRG